LFSFTFELLSSKTDICFEYIVVHIEL